MEAIIEIAARHNLQVLEDAAQGMMAHNKGQPLCSIGSLGALVSHKTKNLTSGEGGALTVNHPDLAQRAEIIRKKGTNRNQFLRGAVDNYTWQEIGSPFLPDEIVAAFLWALLEEAKQITRDRLDVWARYHAQLEDLETAGVLR